MAETRVPPLDLKQEIESLRPELQEAIDRVVSSGQFILGPEGEALEAEIAAHAGARGAVGVSSGTDALRLALEAMGVGPGDEVITTPFSFVATGETVSQLGATPVFADIEPDTFNIDPAQAESLISSRTRALLPVHLFGHPAAADRLREIAAAHGLWLLEDGAQALGARLHERAVGTFGHATALSFFPTKNLSAFGDAGMILTQEEALAETCRQLRNHGQRKRYHAERLGHNARLDEIQAAVLRVKLPHLGDRNEARRAVAAVYDEALAEIPGVQPPIERPGAEHVYHQYTVRLPAERRDVVSAALAEEGIRTMCYYPCPLPHLPVYGRNDLRFPEAEKAAAEVLSLPMWPDMPHETARDVAEAIARHTALATS